MKKILSGTSLIAGTTIGAGMLGIPIVTAKAGFFPAFLITVCAWFFMLLTGLLYLEVALSLPPGSNIFTMSRYYLGSRGKIGAGGMFLFLYYCLLVAYFSGGAPLLGFVLSQIGISLQGIGNHIAFGVIFGGVVWLGSRWIDRVNFILVIAMIFSYVLLISGGVSEVKWAQLKTGSWIYAPLALPVLFSAFGYHNVIPSLCTYLNRDRRSLILSIFLGTGIALVIYLIWQWLILGTLSPDLIRETLLSGKPVTVALQGVTGKSTLLLTGRFFAFFSLVTSLLGVAFSVVDFLNDGLKIEGKNRFLLVALTFGPPGIFAAVDPTVFEKALSVAGGFGEAFLNGILPVLLVWKSRTKRKELLFRHPSFASNRLLFALFLFSCFVIFLEVGILSNFF